MTRAQSKGGVLRARFQAWLTGPPNDFASLPPLAAWDRPLKRILPYVLAVLTGFQIAKFVVVPEGIGFDARLYVLAARTWINGGDPWSVSAHGIPFAAPPPTLLAFVPFIPFPDWLVTVAWVMGSFALGLLAIKALRLPLWWICFWPIVDGAMNGNPDIAVLAVLVMARQRFAGIAPMFKIYAVLPIIAERRWKSLVVFALLLLATAPVLPWGLWVAALPSISLAFERFADTTSVMGDPVLVVVAVAALTLLGFRRAGWLAVPVLWPWTQPHYLAMSVPALSPMLAIFWSLPTHPPTVVLGGLVLAAVGARMFPLQPRPTHSDLRNVAPSALRGGRSISAEYATVSPPDGSA